MMSRILAIDFGAKRSGLAVTDPLQIIVNPLAGIDTNHLFDYICKYLDSEKVEKIVFGSPKFADDTETPLTLHMNKFMTRIKKSFPHLEFDTIDEGFTTVRAKEALYLSGTKKSKRKNKYLIDKMSAVIILQEYLGHI